MTDILAEVSCSSSFNMQSVLVSRESLWRLCGYGLSSGDTLELHLICDNAIECLHF